MKKILSTAYSNWALNLALLISRAGSGIVMLMHGYTKLVRFHDMKNSFVSFLGLGSTVSLSLVIFSELFCSMFLVLGLFSRIAVIPLIISTSVALFKVHHGDIFGDGEKTALFLFCFITVLLVGPGKASVDGIMGK